MDTSLCKLPRDTLVDIDRAVWINDDFSFYLLYKNGHIFIVQGPKSTKCDPFITSDRPAQELHLKLILQLSEVIPIERYKYLYLYQDEKTNEYRLVPKKKSHTLYKIKSPLWLPTVQESELQLIRWIGWGRCVCLLRGDQIEVDIAWDTVTFRQLEKITNVVKVLAELDVCFRPIAHVLRGSDIIGLAYEKRAGRGLQYSDRRLFYQTLAKMHSRRVYYRGICYSICQVHDGGIRFTDNLFVVEIRNGPRTEEEDEQERRIWAVTGELFDKLKIKMHVLMECYALAEPPILMRYHQCVNSEHPRYNPSILTHIDHPYFALFRGRETSYTPRRLTGVIRSNRPMFVESPSPDDNAITTSTALDDNDRPLVVPLFTAKRHRKARSTRRIHELRSAADRRNDLPHRSRSIDTETLVDSEENVDGKSERFQTVSTWC
ncbi:hypothetical protein E1B28_013689 [Marasmius oreades]|uniref:Uncharacterized protein n=1 Tax=Marasmius oreades TaxID=181124 RepID=A0A9P7RRI8_9AGAR|nr:uncharacterized protein E1B28_013689 [Marasmius oreades]KAG7087748.1 hypothetical protein E1B28_013689 [Marasmius oreades]